jgi:hypothetical protein
MIIKKNMLTRENLGEHLIMYILLLELFWEQNPFLILSYQINIDFLLSH